MKEEWRDIKGYEGRYQISSFGRVKSLMNNRGKYREKIIDRRPNKYGYKRVGLYKNGKSKFYSVHRLVALHFLPNPNNLPQVNHKDENKENNRVDNLEWCDSKYNNNYGTRNKRIGEKTSVAHKSNRKNVGSNSVRARKVQCITTGKKFNCIKEAGEYYLLNSYKEISQVCKGKRKSCGKHPVTGEKLKWRYIDS